MTEITTPVKSNEQKQAYKCPKCGCEFTGQEDEPQVCKCNEKKESKGCACCN